jgi:hypothetical protein
LLEAATKNRVPKYPMLWFAVLAYLQVHTYLSSRSQNTTITLVGWEVIGRLSRWTENAFPHAVSNAELCDVDPDFDIHSRPLVDGVQQPVSRIVPFSRIGAPIG